MGRGAREKEDTWTHSFLRAAGLVGKNTRRFAPLRVVSLARLARFGIAFGVEVDEDDAAGGSGMVADGSKRQERVGPGARELEA